MNFSNKVVLVTGGARGIGRAACIEFAKRGAKVIINFKEDEKAAQQTLSLLNPNDHMVYKADIADSSQVKSMIDNIAGHYGKLDIVVNNAGMSYFHEIDKVSFDEWQAAWNTILDTNLRGAANVCYCVAQQMIKQRGGRIINVSSRGAFRGEPLKPAYGASKAALNSMSQSLAKKLGKYNIFVGVVAPGFVETDSSAKRLSTPEGAEIKNESPLCRVAKPEEVAYAIAFLASEDAEFTTGAILDVNGASYLRT